MKVEINERLINEYLSKVECCDECFASVYCTVNRLRESRVPQDYCAQNIKRYFGDEAKPIDTSGDLISREAVKNYIKEVCFSKEWAKYRYHYGSRGQIECILTYIDDAPTIEFPTVINMKPLTAEEKQGLIDAFKKSGLKAVKLDDGRTRGEWIEEHLPKNINSPEDTYTCFCCSECGFHFDDTSNFCSNCGADMRKKIGEWIPNKENLYSNSGRYCSLCGEIVEFSEPVCPGCGAQMKIGGEES